LIYPEKKDSIFRRGTIFFSKIVRKNTSNYVVISLEDFATTHFSEVFSDRQPRENVKVSGPFRK